MRVYLVKKRYGYKKKFHFVRFPVCSGVLQRYNVSLLQCDHCFCHLGNKRNLLDDKEIFQRIHKIKRIFILVISLLISAMSLPVWAANIQLTDQAELFTEEEAAELNQQIEDLEKNTGWDIMAVTTEDAAGMDATTYAEHWFDQHTEKDNGIICMIDMDNREITIRAFGECRFYITDNQTEDILDAGYKEISEEHYKETLQVMLEGVQTAYIEEKPQNNYLYDEDTGEVTSYKQEHKEISKLELILAGVVAILAGGASAGGIIGKYHLKFGGYQYPIEKNGNVRLKKKEDQLIHQFVTHRHIPKENSNGGESGNKSTVHTGAGGRSSSGGSRKF